MDVHFPGDPLVVLVVELVDVIEVGAAERGAAQDEEGLGQLERPNVSINKAALW